MALEVRERLIHLIEMLNLGENGRRMKTENMLDVDEVMKSVGFQKALMYIPEMFEDSGRKGKNSYLLKHQIERATKTYLSNAECILAFAFLKFPVSSIKHDTYNFTIKAAYKDFGIIGGAVIADVYSNIFSRFGCGNQSPLSLKTDLSFYETLKY